MAAALLAMSAKDYAAACASFRSMVNQDPMTFVGFFGLGECARLDTVVLRGPSGARFRSSHWSAIMSYAEAVDRAPTSELLGALFPSVMTTTYASGNRMRIGAASGDVPSEYSALPSLDHDTLAFVPIPDADFAGLGPRAVPETHARALRRGREVALDLTSRWTRRFPQSSDAWFERSLALELAGRIDDGPADVSATAALERAAAAVSDGWKRARIAVARARLALRRLDFVSAGRTARAAIAEPLPRESRTRATLAPLAALVGDVAKGESLAVDENSGSTVLPALLADSLRRFRVRAVSGRCEGLDARRQELERMFAVSFAPAELKTQREQLLLPVYREAITCIGPSLTAEFRPTRPMDSVFQALAANDLIRARRLLASLRQNRAGVNIGAVSWDHLFVESWALAQAGDTATARDQLAAASADLASMSGFTLSETSQAAGLRRGLGLLIALSATGAPAALREKWRNQYAQLQSIEPTDKSRNP